MQVLKINAEQQALATDHGIVVCWHGDMETGFFYTDVDHAELLDGEIVDIAEHGGVEA